MEKKKIQTAFRMDSELLEYSKQKAEQNKINLIDYVETAIKEKIERDMILSTGGLLVVVPNPTINKNSVVVDNEKEQMKIALDKLYNLIKTLNKMGENIICDYLSENAFYYQSKVNESEAEREKFQAKFDEELKLYNEIFK